MKRIFLFYIVSVLIVLLGCGEDEQIKALQEEQRQLLFQKDSLLKRQSELEKSSDLTLVSDTVKAGNGLFQVLERMGLSEEERRLIVLSIQDSVELSKMRVGQKFHALLDGNKKVKVFRYEENPATIHLLFKMINY